MKTCVLICNKESGFGIKDKELDKIKQILVSKGYSVSLAFTSGTDDASKIIKGIDHADLVLSIGGDGTFNEIVRGNLERKERLLISHIPCGTTNDIGNMLGLGKNMVKNVMEILDGEVKAVDIGKFINVPYATSRKLKKKFGYLAYLINGIKEFFQVTRLYDMEYKIDDKEYRGLFSLVLISNANRIAGFNNIYKDVRLDDEKLEVIFCNISRRKDLAKSLLILMTKGILAVPGIYCYKAKKIEINFMEKVKTYWTIDGEKNHKLAKRYVIETGEKMKMLLPKKNLDKLFIK